MPEPETRKPTHDPAAQDPQTLEYEPQPPGRRARKWLVRIALVLVAIIAVEAGLYYYRDVSNWMALVRLRHAVMTHTLPARTPILTQTPSDSPAAWLSKAPTAPGVDRVWTRAENKLIPMLGIGTGHGITVFLHELRSPSGHIRVLAINMSRGYLNNGQGAYMPTDLRLFDPGTLLRPRFQELTVKESKELQTSGSLPGFPGLYIDLGLVPWGSNFQLFGGQIDPADPSRFTIRYTLNGRPGKFIGQLHDDDSISLHDANGTALPEHFPAPTTRPQ